MRKRKPQFNQQRPQRRIAWWFIPPALRAPLLFVAVMVSASFFLRVAIHEFVHKRKFPLMGVAWKSYSPGQSGLSLLLPGEPQPSGLKVSAPGADVQRAEYFQVSVKEFRVIVGSMFYREAAPADFERAAEDLPAILQTSGEVVEYKQSIGRITHVGRSGMLVNGTFKRNGEPRQFRALLLNEGAKLWQVVVSYEASYPAAAKAARQVIDSVKVTEAKAAL